jgi:hypothetical protein
MTITNHLILDYNHTISYPTVNCRMVKFAIGYLLKHSFTRQKIQSNEVY